MAISKTAEATRAVLKQHKDDALNGTLTVDEVIVLVREVVPNAKPEGIYRAILDYGPIGEGDAAWYRRAGEPQIPAWYYSAKSARTGVPV